MGGGCSDSGILDQHFTDGGDTQSTPYELWTGVKPNVNHLKVFGCLAFTHIPSQKIMKLEDKSEMGIFVGYCLQTKTYKVYNPITCKMVLSRDVVFREDEHWDWKL